jgi:hypothetical protein
MSSHVELCEHHAKDCLQAAEKAEDPMAREMLLRHALEWMRDGLAASKQSGALYGLWAQDSTGIEPCTLMPCTNFCCQRPPIFR